MTEPYKKRLADLVRSRTIIHPKHLARESELMMTKWFDYRFMSPFEATMHFETIYRKELYGYVRLNGDIDRAQEIGNAPIRIPTERSGTFTQLWNARQLADELFVPYEISIGFGFHFAQRRTRRMGPRPIQLFANEKTHEAWWPMFMEYVEERLPIAMRRVGDMLQYRTENDRGLPAQHHFREVVAANLAQSSRVWRDTIADVMEKRHLSLEQSLDAAPAHLRDELLKDSETLTLDGPPVVPAQSEDMLMSCFGIRESTDMGLGPCRSCPLHDSCVAFAGTVNAQTEKSTGFASPVYEADKARNRKNTANSRVLSKVATPASLTG
jgi:hypothetical protein